MWYTNHNPTPDIVSEMQHILESIGVTISTQPGSRGCVTLSKNPFEVATAITDRFRKDTPIYTIASRYLRDFTAQNSFLLDQNFPPMLAAAIHVMIIEEQIRREG